MRDIPLTAAQTQRLAEKKRNPAFYAQVSGAQANRLKAHRQRAKYQEEGRIKARERDWLHTAGCMLYWGEGSKERNMCKITNADAGILIMFKQFLDAFFQPADDAYYIRLNCYLGQGISQSEIENWWLSQLKLQHITLKETRLNNKPVSSKQKGRTLIYGTCSLGVNSTQIVQHIFGAIQEYSGIDNPDWIM